MSDVTLCGWEYTELWEKAQEADKLRAELIETKKQLALMEAECSSMADQTGFDELRAELLDAQATARTLAFALNTECGFAIRKNYMDAIGKALRYPKRGE
jgi:hypothetical protein